MTHSLAMPSRAAATLGDVLDLLDSSGFPPIIVGGHVPDLLCHALEPDLAHAPPARKTMDYDLAVQAALDTGDSYEQARAVIEQCGLSPKAYHSFRFEHENGLVIDLLPVFAGFESGEEKARNEALRYVDKRDFFLGYELALDDWVPVRVSVGDRVMNLRVANVVPFFVMKTNSWLDEDRQKDIADVVFVLRYHPHDINAVIEEFRRYGNHPLARKALEILEANFEDAWSPGPAACSRERGIVIDNDAEYRLGCVAAVQRLLRAFGMGLR